MKDYEEIRERKSCETIMDECIFKAVEFAFKTNEVDFMHLKLNSVYLQFESAEELRVLLKSFVNSCKRGDNEITRDIIEVEMYCGNRYTIAEFDFICDDDYVLGQPLVWSFDRDWIRWRNERKGF
jgi:hypothetical protein